MSVSYFQLEPLASDSFKGALRRFQALPPTEREAMSDAIRPHHQPDGTTVLVAAG